MKTTASVAAVSLALALVPGATGAGTAKIYAGMFLGGVYYSTNSGSSWTSVRSGLTDTTITSLAVSGTTVFAGTPTAGVFRSTNSGGLWTAVNSGLTTLDVTALAAVKSYLYFYRLTAGEQVATRKLLYLK
ncbi:MAG TPA: hypothetical protein VL221_10025 [Bacteroidota bacterium]|nr:hypothetical protein [Bacteroidota bacterium]